MKNNTPEKQSVSINDILRFFMTAASWIQSGGKFVDEAEAERRAEICRTCPLNGNYMRGRCPTCFARAAVKLIGSTLKNRYFPKLKYCKACGCDLNVKVYIPLNVINNKGVEYPDHCWQKDKTNGEK